MSTKYLISLWLLIGIAFTCTAKKKKTRNERVLVTGASGFIASHIIKQLLEQGYDVRGTVRSLNNHQLKYKYLYDLQDNSATNKLELVEADLSSDAHWDDIVKDCEYIMSVANPVPSREAKVHLSDDDVINISVNGLNRILNASLKYKNKIKTFVLTGSVAANIFTKENENSIIRRASNESWTDIELSSVSGYAKAKTLQEQYFWSFIAKHNNPFAAVSINPCMVIGPVMNKPSGSVGSILAMLNQEFPFLADWNMVAVDVRDVAIAHVHALTSTNANGNRYIIGTHSVWLKDIAMILNNKYSEFLVSNIPLMVAYDFIWKIIGLFDPVIGEHVAPNLGKLEIVIDNKQTVKDLNFGYTAIDQSVCDCAESLINLGFVKTPTNTMYLITVGVQTLIIGAIILWCWFGFK